MSNKVIMEQPLFYVTDTYGNVDPQHDEGLGLYLQDTRFLSSYKLLINDEQPELLGDGSSASYMLQTLLKHETKDTGAIEIKRNSFLYEGVLHEQLTLTNYFLSKQNVKLTLQFDADFQDMFLVRRYRTGEVGARLDTLYKPSHMVLQYMGKDDVLRQSYIHWDGNPTIDQEKQQLEYTLSLDAGESRIIQLAIRPSLGNPASEHEHELLDYKQALEQLTGSYDNWLTANTKMTSSNALFNELYDRSLQDLRMLQTDIGYGRTTVAGLPWFATVFGRDSIITSLFMLPLHPAHALGTLRTLAAHQGKEYNPWRDEEPGKIMHEIRFGELVRTKQSPFSPYYGGVDSTPLFLVLLVEYVKWSGDTSIIAELQPTIDAALEWIDRRSQSNEAGFLTYKQEAEQGFPNQGWKDSANSIVHEHGELAKAPIALIEVQGYISYAKQGLSEIYGSLNDHARGKQLEEQATALMKQVKRYFWLENEQFFSIALDGDLKPVQSITSNPGHLLIAAMLEDELSSTIAKRLMADDMFSGYGIRTMSNQSTGYYPMSYHNGSVWPHDNGMILLGMLRSGNAAEARQLVSGLLKIAAEVPEQRFPELVCGYSKQEYNRLVPYPTTCSPQAWSSATAFIMLQAMLGLRVNGLKKQILLSPNLPPEIDEVNVVGLSIGAGMLDLYLYLDQETQQSHATILNNTTGFDIHIQILSS
ncbi:glycogen debranching N-terminal domain-containing protein [Paenibacillus septentrionalis]|uniref:Glycogen debranching N-terminal domain-containing protein n=1 Tax=Paenibacillus septentrionalis TaxID=429342 RepID=A0ABW1V5F1_9BACL